MTHKRTLSEIRSMCKLAARGAGCSWGMAEEAGMAASKLQSMGFPAAEALATLFQTPRACRCDGTGPAACGLAEMAKLSDDPQTEKHYEHPIAAPILLLAALDDGVLIDWGFGVASTAPDQIAASADAPFVANKLRLKRTQQSLPRPGWQSQPVDPSAWHILEALAAKTYVPETDQSRLTGAGPDAANDTEEAKNWK